MADRAHTGYHVMGEGTLIPVSVKKIRSDFMSDGGYRERKLIPGSPHHEPEEIGGQHRDASKSQSVSAGSRAECRRGSPSQCATGP